MAGTGSRSDFCSLKAKPLAAVPAAYTRGFAARAAHCVRGGFARKARTCGAPQFFTEAQGTRTPPSLCTLILHKDKLAAAN